jgi:hypothetical protein
VDECKPLVRGATGEVIRGAAELAPPAISSDLVGRCRFTVSKPVLKAYTCRVTVLKPVLKAYMVSALETANRISQTAFNV